jgi:demethylmenaquinone methyltransferase/2-methoxy-6-polyprenyl-1,4-benzoquinol methylase
MAESPQAPHPVLTRYYSDAQARAPLIRQMFDATAPRYDRITGAMSFGSGVHYRRRALRKLGLSSGMTLLDVGCGTGVIAREAARLVGGQGFVVGVDPSAGMLREARENEVRISVQGLGESLPFSAESFDALVMGYALRHVADLDAAFSEFRRVLKPGGVALLLEITLPQSPIGRALLKMYLKSTVPAMARLLGRNREDELLMSYYWDTIEQCVPPEAILDRLRSAGFTGVEREVELGIFSMYLAR